MIRSFHVRRLPTAESEVGALLTTLAGEHDAVWPDDQWPPMVFDRPLSEGAIGGHGPVRYRVEAVRPGRYVRFRFMRPRGFDGFHEFSTVAVGESETELRHLLVVRPRGWARLTARLVWMPMHDALLEDCLARAEKQLSGAAPCAPRWSLHVRVLRRAAAALQRRSGPSRVPGERRVHAWSPRAASLQPRCRRGIRHCGGMQGGLCQPRRVGLTP